MNSAPSTPTGFQPFANSPVDGLAVFIKNVPSPKGTIICVHGGLDRGGSFTRMARRIEDFTTIAYDRRGYQSSRGLGPLSLDAHIEDLITLSLWAKSTGPVILFGHSYGGIVALGAVLENPAIADVVVAYESPMQWILPTGTQYNPLSDDAGFEAERFFRRMVSDASWERLSEKEKQSRRDDGYGLISDLTAVRSKMVPYEIEKIAVPSYYVHGDAFRRDYYRELGAQLTHRNHLFKTRELQGANHGAHLAIPDQVVQLLEEIWNEQCA